MKVFIVCSKHFYDKIPPIKAKLEELGHTITLPNSFDNPTREFEMKALGAEDHAAWKASMLRLQEQKINNVEALLVLNFTKEGNKNYIGGATFLEVFKAWELGKKIFFYNPLPESIFTDELKAFSPLVINSDINLVK